MATQIPKLITNVEPYFRYEGEANATTQDQFQGFLKNEHSVLAVLVKGIWQPTTSYDVGDIITSPNMPKGFHAIAQTKGNSGANEPTWGTGTTNVSDGTVSWKLSKGDITVNGVGADSNGNIQIPIPIYTPVYATQSEAVKGTVSDKIMTPKTTNDVLQNIGYWKPNELVTVGTIRFLKGTKYAGYYLQCTQQGTTGTTEPIPAI